MFKKKKPETPQRQRPTQSVPRNTTVFSYHANRAPAAAVGDERQAKDPLKRQPRQLPLWLKPKSVLGAVIILILFLLLIGLDSRPKVVVVGDDPVGIIRSETYQKAARDLFGGSLMNANKLTVNTAEIATVLQRQFPELRTVSVSLPVLGRQPVLYVQPVTPQLVIQTKHSGAFVLDSNGRAFAAVADLRQLQKQKNTLPIITDQTDVDSTIGNVVLPRDSVQFIAEIAAQLRAKQIATETWTLPAGSSELEVKIANTPYFVKFNLQGKAREQAGTFLALHQYLGSQNVVPGQYIDARVTGRAYYK